MVPSQCNLLESHPLEPARILLREGRFLSQHSATKVPERRVPGIAFDHWLVLAALESVPEVWH